MICVTCCHLSLPCCSINHWTPAVSRRNSSRQSSDHFWRKTSSNAARWRISGWCPTCHLSQSCWRRLSRRAFRNSLTAMDWCLECSLGIAGSTAPRRRWWRCSAIYLLLQTVVRFRLFACLTSQQPSTLSTMTLLLRLERQCDAWHRASVASIVHGRTFRVVYNGTAVRRSRSTLCVLFHKARCSVSCCSLYTRRTSQL